MMAHHPQYRYLLLTAAVYSCFLVVDCYRIGLTLIPNGYHVPNPCNGSDNKVWTGVGHVVQAGGGPLNLFGDDFLLTNRVRAISHRINYFGSVC